MRVYGPDSQFQTDNQNNFGCDLGQNNGILMSDQDMRMNLGQIRSENHDQAQSKIDYQHNQKGSTDKTDQFEGIHPTNNQFARQDFNYKNMLLKQTNNLDLSRAETQNDSTEVQMSESASYSNQTKLRPRLQEILNNSKNSSTFRHYQNETQGVQLSQGAYNNTNCIQFPNNINSQYDKENNQFQTSNYRNRMGATLFRPLTNLVNNAQILNQSQHFQINQRFDSPPQKRTYISKPKKVRRTRVFAINESPLIADYGTQYISYDGLQTPLNLVSPNKKYVEIGEQNKPDSFKQLFKDEIKQDFIKNEQIIESIDESSILPGPTVSTSNLPEHCNSAQSILHLILKDDKNEQKEKSQMKRRLFDSEKLQTELIQGNNKPDTKFIESSCINEAINNASLNLAENIVTAQNPDRLYSQIQNDQVCTPSILNSNANMNIAVGFSQMNLGEIDNHIDIKQNQQNDQFDLIKQQNSEVIDKNAISDMKMSGDEDINQNSLRFNICHSKQLNNLMLKPNSVRAKVSLLNNLDVVSEENQRLTKQRETIPPYVQASQDGKSQYFQTDLASQDNKIYYQSTSKKNSNQGQPIKRTSKKRALEEIFSNQENLNQL